MLVSSFLAGASAMAMLPSSAIAQRWEPLPTCWTCVSRSRILSPALGIDIEPSYLTAAIRFHNGTVRSLVKIDASPAYQDLMRRLESREVEDNESPHALPQQQLNQHQRLELRTEEPSYSNCVEIIGTALATLKAAAEPLLDDQPFPPALPTYPHFFWLFPGLVQDAMEFANIRTLGDQRVAPVGAAAAAHGIGLCQSFTDLDACEDEEVGMPMTRVLAIECTKVALTVTLSPFQASRKGYDWDRVRAWDLGANSLPQSPEGEGDVTRYWQRVRETIQMIPRRAPAERPVTRVLVMGESVLDETFLGVMRDALKDVLPDLSVGVDESRILDPTFAAARGAAEFGKRMMEAPDGCAELAICKWWRRRIG